MDRAILRTVAAAFAGGVTGSVLTLAFVVLLTVLLGGCASPPPPLAKPAAAYVRAHPAPPRPGMTAGVVTGWSEPENAINFSWAATVVTAHGQRTIRCGSPQFMRPLRAEPHDCSHRGAPTGTYIYFANSGEVPDWNDIQTITPGAVSQP